MEKEKDKAVTLKENKQKNQKVKLETPPRTLPLDPTRFGDWTVKGRCIDF